MNISEFTRSFEMARADLKNIVEAVEDGNLDRAASLYIAKAKARGLEGIQILAGLGSLLREATDLSTDEIKGLKGEVKDKLEAEPEEKKPLKKKKKAKAKKDDGDEDEDDEEGGEDKEEGEEEDEEKEPEDEEDEEEEGEKKPPKKKKKVKKEKGEEEEESGEKMPPMSKLPESTHVHRLTLRDEILARSGLFRPGQYMREEGEGDAGKAHGSKKSKKSMGPGKKGFGGKTQMEITGGNKARGNAPKRAEDEQEGPEDYEGLTKAMGTGDGGGAGGRDSNDSLRHPAKGVGYTLGNKGGNERPNSDPNMPGGVAPKKGKRGPTEGNRDNIDNEGLAGAPGLGDGAGDFGRAQDSVTHPTRGVSYTLGNRKGKGQPSSDPNVNSGMKYTGRNEEGGGSTYTVPKGKGSPPVSDPNMRNKKGWK